MGDTNAVYYGTDLIIQEGSVSTLLEMDVRYSQRGLSCDALAMGYHSWCGGSSLQVIKMQNSYFN